MLKKLTSKLSLLLYKSYFSESAEKKTQTHPKVSYHVNNFLDVKKNKTKQEFSLQFKS